MNIITIMKWHFDDFIYGSIDGAVTTFAENESNRIENTMIGIDLFNDMYFNVICSYFLLYSILNSQL